MNLCSVVGAQVTSWDGEGGGGSIWATDVGTTASIPTTVCRVSVMCSHIVIDRTTCYLTQSQYSDSLLTSSSDEAITPGAWQCSHKGADFQSHWSDSTREPRVRSSDLSQSSRTVGHLTTEAVVADHNLASVRKEGPLRQCLRPAGQSVFLKGFWCAGFILESQSSPCTPRERRIVKRERDHRRTEGTRWHSQTETRRDGTARQRLGETAQPDRD